MDINLKIVLGVIIGIMGIIGFLLFMSPTLQLDFADTLGTSCKAKAIELNVWPIDIQQRRSDWSVDEFYKKLDEYAERMETGECPLPQTFLEDTDLYLREKYPEDYT